MSNYTNELILNIPSQKLYEAITTKKGLTSWWSQEVEIFLHIGGIATFRFGKDAHAVMKIAKLVPNKEVVWKCVEQHFAVKGTDKTDEWVGTTIRFSIVDSGDGKSKLLFTHEGLIEELLCYEDCKKGWNTYLNSLKDYLEKGKGKPYIVK